MALYYTLPSSTLLGIILVFLLFTSVINCETGSCPPTLPSLTRIAPLQPQTPTLQVPPVLPVTPSSLPQTPTLNFPPFLPVAPPSSLETPTLPGPFLPVTPPSIPETPTLNFPPTLPVTPPSLPETPTLAAPFLPGTPPYLPETPTPYVPAPPAFPFPPKQDNKNACPKDVLKLGVCIDMLGKSIGDTIGSPPKMPCCKIMDGLLDFEAAVCLCTAMRANVMGTVLDFPIAINNVFNNCQKDLPSGFQCE